MFLSWIFAYLKEINIVSESSSHLTQLPNAEAFFSADCSILSNFIFRSQVYTQVTVRCEDWITRSVLLLCALNATKCKHQPGTSYFTERWLIPILNRSVYPGNNLEWISSHKNNLLFSDKPAFCVEYWRSSVQTDSSEKVLCFSLSACNYKQKHAFLNKFCLPCTTRRQEYEICQGFVSYLRSEMLLN